MKIRTTELKGTALNYAVAIAEGYAENIAGYSSFEAWAHAHSFDPVNNWEDVGPIIDREHISISHDGYCVCPVFIPSQSGGCYKTFGSHGPTRLIAAMRCYVASKLGEEIDIPEEISND